MHKCAFLSMDNLEAFECYDQLLYDPFADIGWQVDSISWRDETVDWDRYEVVIIRSCWDYHHEPDKFLKVLHNINNSTARLANSLAVIEWNIHKSYLKKLKNKGLPVVPTIINNNVSSDQIENYYSKLNTDEMIIKPTVGAGSDDTFWLKQGSKDDQTHKLETIFRNKNFLVQPFVNNILSEGEYSLFYFNGHYSHTILKTPRTDDFRVQEEHGGRLQSVKPENALLRLSEQTLKALPEKPLYARLDFVRNENEFQIMEVELIEPSLYFNMDPDSPQRFTRAFKNWWNN